MKNNNSHLDLLLERKALVQRVVDLTTGTDIDQLEENMRELRSAISKIENKQPVSGIRVRRYVDRFFASIPSPKQTMPA